MAQKITPLQFVNPYGFSVYLTSTQTPPGSTFTKIVFNIEEYDDNNNFDNATNFQYTAPVAGKYHFEGRVGASASRVIASIFKNGAEYKRGNDMAASGSSVSSHMKLAAGDTIYLGGFVTSGAFASSGTQDTYFNGILEGV